ncbi:zf-HC2 domain-containing protein [Gracilibacillus oryzae]|uniref:Zf-HC2 domain-containing protein n=1 Tax=Gracilibacillus oryzae TaxID=1672701 RepID=A0A7C8GR17_9BACI|nr:zf-HC2 domain-containing protein [Gracilibacillus oryzae]KAB8127454.1 zf-HC2 domain-containing protein [Gracilibacillus oryzae]
MEHIQNEKLSAYCNNQLPEEEQTIIDNHLTECESCFSLYLEAIDNCHIDHSVSESFTDKTMEELELSPLFNQESRPSSKKKNRIMAHYLLAAGLTLIFTFSGLFESVLHLSEQTDAVPKVSVSEQLMNKTTDFLDQIKEDNNK